MSRSEKSAEAVVAAGKGRRAERVEVFETMSMLNALRQKSAPAERAGVAHGEAGRDPVSDEADNPRQDTESTGSALLEAVLTRENLQRAWKRVRANKGAAGVDGLDIEQTARHLVTAWPKIRDQLLRGTYRPSPVRRIMIPKPEGGERELGIPTVTDRLRKPSIAASAATDTGPDIQRAQLRLPTGTASPRRDPCGAGLHPIRSEDRGGR